MRIPTLLVATAAAAALGLAACGGDAEPVPGDGVEVVNEAPAEDDGQGTDDADDSDDSSDDSTDDDANDDDANDDDGTDDDGTDDDSTDDADDSDDGTDG